MDKWVIAYASGSMFETVNLSGAGFFDSYEAALHALQDGDPRGCTAPGFYFPALLRASDTRVA